MEGKKNSDYKYKKIVSAAIAFVAVFVVGVVIGQRVDGTKIASSFGKKEDVNMDMFWNVWDIVSTQYVDADKVDPEKMVTGAIKGMVNSFEDPATVFLDPEETKIISTGYSSTLSDSNEFDINKGGLLDRLSGHGQKDQMVYKSRRIENAKRSEFQGKLNKILFVVILLVILLIWAVFNI